MRLPKHPTLLRRMLDSRVKQCQPQGPLLAASLVACHRRCGKKNCTCTRGQLHLAYQLTFKEQGQSRSVYVSKELLTEVRSWIEQHTGWTACPTHATKTPSSTTGAS